MDISFQHVHFTRRIHRLDLRVRRSGVYWIVNLDDAIACAPHYDSERDLNIDPAFHPTMFDEIAADALEYSRLNNTPKCHAADRYIIGILLDWFGGRVVSEITARDISDEFAELVEEGKKPATCERYRSLLNSAFSLALRTGKVKSNPVDQVPPQSASTGRVRFLKSDEEIRLRARIREIALDREPEFELALQTGLRRGEQYGLTWTDVDLDTGVLQVVKSKNGTPRKVLLNSAARAAVERLLELNERNDLVCPPQGRWFERAVQLAGIPDFRWHDLRHTFASRLAMSGVDLRTIQELLGHKSFAVTLKYVHLATGHLHESLEHLCRESAGVEATR
jgi:site-specific recombinase XerD